jgi:hypothetical protein
MLHLMEPAKEEHLISVLHAPPAVTLKCAAPFPRKRRFLFL